MKETESVGPVRISTDAFPEHARLSLWREVFGRNITHVDIEPLDDRPFGASATFQTLPGLGVAIGSRSDARYIIGSQGVAKAQDQVVLSLVTRGVGHISQLNREASGGPGCAVLLSGVDPASATLRGDGAFITLAFPRADFAALIPDLGAAIIQPIHETNQALRLLIGYLGVLRDSTGAMDPAVAQAFATHVLDLAALAVGARGERREIARSRGAKAAWRRAIGEEINARAHTPNASAQAIAGKLGISERYLRLILEETGDTFSALVLDRRLDLAWRRLNDSRAGHQTISEIALASGFSDLSHFNRSFRRRFGDTPSRLRIGH
jgi:AraC-like DNA-binding protein